jgi:hypothetical protein
MALREKRRSNVESRRRYSIINGERRALARRCVWLVVEEKSERQ